MNGRDTKYTLTNKNCEDQCAEAKKLTQSAQLDNNRKLKEQWKNTKYTGKTERAEH